MVITGRGSYIAVRYVNGLLDVSPGVTTETVEPGLLLLLLQLQRLDLRLQLLQLVLQMFALLHVLQPASTRRSSHRLQEAILGQVCRLTSPSRSPWTTFSCRSPWSRGAQNRRGSLVLRGGPEEQEERSTLRWAGGNVNGGRVVVIHTLIMQIIRLYGITVPGMWFWWSPAASVWLSAQHPWPQSDPVSDDLPPST